jgi:photolyase PhrII
MFLRHTVGSSALKSLFPRVNREPLTLDATAPLDSASTQRHLPGWLPTLRPLTAERVRLVDDRHPHAHHGKPTGEFVLYWMQTALRALENPALDVACQIAQSLDLPVLVYQGLSERYPFASDRHHVFILQGARVVHRDLANRGIPSVFHLERRHHRGPHLRHLASLARVVVTEDFPVEPVRSWVERLASRLTTPLLAVDTACIVPMRLVGRSYDRAFAYRQATHPLARARLGRPYHETEWSIPQAPLPDLPFQPIDLERSDLPALIAECDIDHSVAPVADVTGGTDAGLSRWQAFLAERLRHYADTRNDALADGASGMSPYLRYGMVSPFRIAREAAHHGGKGAEKFLDELLIWRELSYSFCFHRADHGSLSALPVWAVRSLVDHEVDERPRLFDWETLARGETGQKLWDAAQKSLLIHGRLHNNVRMTWGKAIPTWTPDPATALETLVDLNHRYALDGRDPSSYGGLLWCLGQFDRPFTPAHPVVGTIRPRPLRDHSRRLNPDDFHAHATRPPRNDMPTVAVIGAGLAGLICARTLVDHRFSVTVFEKSRGFGGRMATRRTEPGMEFDHGAQYFTVRSDAFRRYVTAWQTRGLVAEWAASVVRLTSTGPAPLVDQPTRYVAVPGMNALGQHLARDLSVQRETGVARLLHTPAGWELFTADGASLGRFDRVVLAIPAPQAATLLGEHSLAATCRAIPMTPCFAAMLAFDEETAIPFDAAFVDDSPLAWIARNSSKPGRPVKPETWVLHATPDWSTANQDAPPNELLAQLQSEFQSRTGIALPAPVSATLHRWMYALSPAPSDSGCLFDPETGVAVAGDWLNGNRVEGAFHSGVAAFGAIARHALIR